MTEATTTPEISVVLVTDGAGAVTEVVEHLRRQTIRDRLELVLATDDPDGVASGDFDDGRLAAVRIVGVETITPLAVARADAVRAASAPYVFLGETHTFPEPEMLERLLEAHRAGWGRVAPLLENANPRNVWSWAGFLLDYGRFAGPATSAEARAPVYNCSYLRSHLLDLEPLGRLLEGGSTLNDDLARAGCRSFRVGDARLAHLNVATPSGLIRERYLVGRAIGGRLSRHWPLWRRVVYVAGAPLIPLVLASRTLRAEGMRDRVRASPRMTLTAMLLGLVLRAAGEAVAYAAGPGAAESGLEEMEIHKRRWA